MVNFRNHIYKQKINLKDVQGVEEEYEFRALSGRDLPKLFEIARQFKGLKEGDQEAAMDAMTEGTVNSMIDLIIKMIRVSYPSISEEDAETFAGIHFNELSKLLFELNFNKK